MPVVTGVGGAAIPAAEAMTLLLAGSSPLREVIVASAAFLFLVEGGMMPAAAMCMIVALVTSSVDERAWYRPRLCYSSFVPSTT